MFESFSSISAMLSNTHLVDFLVHLVGVGEARRRLAQGRLDITHLVAHLVGREQLVLAH